MIIAGIDLHLASWTPTPMGLIKWGLVPGAIDLPFLFLRVAELEGNRDVVWDFQFALRDGSELASRFFKLEFIEAMRCSLAFLEAFVSLANRGVDTGVFDAATGVGGWVGVSTRGSIVWPWFSLLRSDLGAPRPVGYLTNLLSAEEEVGKSSNDSSSVPSPKFRR